MVKKLEIQKAQDLMDEIRARTQTNGELVRDCSNENNHKNNKLEKVFQEL